MATDDDWRASETSRANGQDKQSSFVVLENRSSERATAIEQGLTEFQKALAERDRLADEVRRAEDRNYLLGAEVEMRDRMIAELHRRISELEADRDRKVADFAILETLFISLRAQLDSFTKLPAPEEPKHGPPQASAAAPE